MTSIDFYRDSYPQEEDINFPREYEGWDIECDDSPRPVAVGNDPYDPFQMEDENGKA